MTLLPQIAVSKRASCNTSVLNVLCACFSVHDNSFTWSLPCSKAYISFSETCFIKSRLDNESVSFCLSTTLLLHSGQFHIFSFTSYIRTFAHVFPSAFIPFPSLPISVLPVLQESSVSKKSGTYGELTNDKGGMIIQWRKESLFSKWCWENWTATCKKVKPFFNSVFKNKLKMD